MKHLAVFFCLLFVCGCGLSGRNKAKPSRSNVDRSHTPEEAVEKGAPSVDRSWVFADYAAFDTYLSELPQDAYPRITSTRSKTLFMKLVDSAEQGILSNKDIGINSRMQMVLQMGQAELCILNKYMSAHGSGIDYSTELMYLSGVALVMTRQMLVLLDEFMPTIDPSDGTYDVRMEGLERLKDGLATQLAGDLLSLQETHVYSDADRRVLAGYLAREAPTFLAHLEPSVRREMEIKIGKLVTTETDSVIRDMLSALLDDLERTSPSTDGQPTR